MDGELPLYDLIYALVRQVPRGRVATYGQIARIAGRCSAQMVGFALAALPAFRARETNGDVPWQRIINARGMISPHGYGMGSLIQRQLLEEEGIIFDEHGGIDLAEFGWDERLTNAVTDGKSLI